jgi:drug/metabolite transporter (DMT)-like permease
LVPLYSALLAWWFLREPLMLYHLVGFALILGGVGLASRRAQH